MNKPIFATRSLNPPFPGLEREQRNFLSNERNAPASSSPHSKRDPDTLFRVVATATSEANMRQGSALTVVPRRTLLNDPELKEKNRFYPAATTSFASGMPFPQIPEFYAVGEIIARHIQLRTESIPL